MSGGPPGPMACGKPPHHRHRRVTLSRRTSLLRDAADGHHEAFEPTDRRLTVVARRHRQHRPAPTPGAEHPGLHIDAGRTMQ
jgi:hypothetical protein